MPTTTAQETSRDASGNASGASETDNATSELRTVTLGLVASPDHCQRVATAIVETLPDQLTQHIDDQVTWEVKSISNPLAGSDVGEEDLLNEVLSRLQAGGWNYAISLTDLPIRRNRRIHIAGASIERNVAYISLPPLGVMRLRARVQNLVLELVNEMRWGRPPSERQPSEDAGVEDREIGVETDRLSRQMIAKGVAEQISPFDADKMVGVRYIAPNLTGHARLLTGMVYANGPWTLFPRLKTAVAAALATGGYMLVFTTMWEVGNAYAISRLILLMFTAMTILTTWIVMSHGLWESQRGATSKYLATIYNISTVLTIATGVVFAYSVIFVFLFLASWLFVPESMLEDTLGEAISMTHYVHIAWVAASVASIAGALGVGMEDTNAVRDATFGWRQRHRFEQYQNDEESA